MPESGEAWGVRAGEMDEAQEQSGRRRQMEVMEAARVAGR